MNRAVKGKLLCSKCRPEMLKWVGAVRDAETGRAVLGLSELV